MLKPLPPTFQCSVDIQKEVLAKLQKLSEAESDVPGVIIVHDIRDGKVIYMSERGLNHLGITLEKLQALQPKQYHDNYFNPEDAANYVPKIYGLLERNNDEEIVTYFQQVRKSCVDEWFWYSSSTKIFARDEEGKPILTVTIAIPNDTKSHLTTKVERLMHENTFLKKHQREFASLSIREQEVLKLLAQGHNVAEIATILFISIQTAMTHKRNLKKKLKVKNPYDLTRFAQAFDLI